MKDINVTVIIPTYNSSSYIDRTLKCLFNQKDINYEIIIIDDGSTDNTYETIKKILSFNIDKSDYVKVFRKANGGVSSARNLGIEKAKGDYILFLDSDDYIDEKALKSMYNNAVENLSDIVFCGYSITDEELNILSAYEKKYLYISGCLSGPDMVKKYLSSEISIFTGSAIYKRELINNFKVTFMENCKYGEDQEFILKSLFHSKRVSNVKKVFSYYVQRKDSVMKIFNKNRIDSVVAFRRVGDYILRFEDNQIINDLITNKISEEIIFVINSYLKLNIEGTIINVKYIKNNILNNTILELKMVDNIYTNIKIMCIKYFLFLYVIIYKFKIIVS